MAWLCVRVLVSKYIIRGVLTKGKYFLQQWMCEVGAVLGSLYCTRCAFKHERNGERG